MLSSNLNSVIACTKTALPDMLQGGWGRIVNISSISGLIGQANASAYCAAKHALVGLTRSLALEVAKNAITVNAICPSYTETEAAQQEIAQIAQITGRTTEDMYGEWAKRNPQGRLVQVQEVAHAVAWLCMPGASAINGQAIVIDGGELIA
jgi:3-hydroxybutyrate dehydrogenase